MNETGKCEGQIAVVITISFSSFSAHLALSCISNQMATPEGITENERLKCAVYDMIVNLHIICHLQFSRMEDGAVS